MTPTVETPEQPEATPSLSFSMRMFAEESGNRRVASAFNQISDALDRGADWHEALAAGGRRLPKFLRGAFAVAERSGRLERIVTDYFTVRRRYRRAQRRVTTALVYPAIIMLAFSVLASGIVFFVVPQFKEIFNDFGVELPWATRLLLEISDFLVNYWPVFAVLIALGSGAFLFLMGFFRTAASAALVRDFQSIPVLGTASSQAAASEFCSFLGILVEARTPLPDAFRLTAGALRDPNLRLGSEKVALGVEKGENPAYAAMVTPHFTPVLVQLLRHSERDDSFADVLKSHGELFALQAEAHSGIATVWMQPFLLVLVGIFAGFIVISLFLPLIKLLNELS